MTDFMQSIQSLNHHGIDYRILISANDEIIIRYNEYGIEHTDEVYAADGSLIHIVEVVIQGGAC